jgi:hypothetical protein
MKKRTYLDDQWKFLDANDLSSLNVGKGTLDVLDPETQEIVPHKLRGATLDLIKYAYERGLANKPLY